MYKNSLIIPVYNAEAYLEERMSALLRMRDCKKAEVLLIDDGSEDGSLQICRKFERRYRNVRVFAQQHRGVSAARNVGLRNAVGTYIFFLDADDELARGTIKKVSAFFDRIADLVDLVTYPLETIYQGKILQPHFRYRFLKQSGVYDLCTLPFIGQTTMNIVIKNRFENNILFSETQNFSEDQRYCCDILAEKLKMGFCEKGKYLYYRSSSSASGKLSGACYIFEQCMSFFEQLFDRYEYVPLAFQGLFVNDIYWKMTSNILFPYHYGPEAYATSVERIRKLLRKCYPSVILDHPQIDFFEKYYLMRLKDEGSILPEVTDQAFSLYSEGYLVCRETSMEMVLTKVTVRDGYVRIQGFLKSAFFQFGTCTCSLYAVENAGDARRKLQLLPSAHNYYLSYEPTQRFKAYTYTHPAAGLKTLSFEVELGGHTFPVHYYFMPLTPFSHGLKKYRYQKDGVQIEINERNIFQFCRFQQPQKPIIWLYYDCTGVSCDNGMLQFLHDLKREDRVSRFYVVTDLRQMENLPEDCCIRFGSDDHKRLLLEADQVITAYIEENNIYPYDSNEYELYADQFHFEITYLQHGVLHIKMPWKYSPERIQADRIVVSTQREAKLFIDNGFEDAQLLKTRMPRFQTPPARGRISTKKILFAPSWRSYLVGASRGGQWQAQPEKVIESKFFQTIMELLQSDRLKTLLDKNGYSLEVKLHPIFQNYQSLFCVDNQTIRFVTTADEPQNYDLFITDFSSYLYDFVYQQIPVISFIPDYDEFRCGMNGYRDLNYPPEFWAGVSRTPEELLDVIFQFLTGYPVNQIEDIFFECDDPMEEIYHHLMKKQVLRQKEVDYEDKTL